MVIICKELKFNWHKKVIAPKEATTYTHYCLTKTITMKLIV